jgi:iron-sulfur cluster protein
MGAAARPPPPTWIEKLPRRPLCDVPWLGRAVILSDGRVNFCCFSEAVVGNVNQTPLVEVWRGPVMRKIREELTRQRFPAECRSNSCPLFRGDEHTYLLDRMDGYHRPFLSHSDDPHAGTRANLAASRLAFDQPRVASGQTLAATLTLEYAANWIAADVFAGVTFPDGRIRFLPDFCDFPFPLARYVELGDWKGPVVVKIVDRIIDAAIPPGRYELCVALVAPNGNPSVAANCFWSARAGVEVSRA